jgi:cofilin
MQSGINIPDTVREEFQALRMKRKHRYIIFRASADKSSVEIDKLGERSADWEEFKNSMPKNNSRWAIYDLEWTEKDGRKVSKLVFIMYSPDDNADNAEKFVIACNKDQLKAKVSETNRDWQVNRWDDLVEATIIKQFE